MISGCALRFVRKSQGIIKFFLGQFACIFIIVVICFR
jgi:hypothetical protein